MRKGDFATTWGRRTPEINMVSNVFARNSSKLWLLERYWSCSNIVSVTKPYFELREKDISEMGPAYYLWSTRSVSDRLWTRRDCGKFVMWVSSSPVHFVWTVILTTGTENLTRDCLLLHHIADVRRASLDKLCNETYMKAHSAMKSVAEMTLFHAKHLLFLSCAGVWVSQ